MALDVGSTSSRTRTAMGFCFMLLSLTQCRGYMGVAGNRSHLAEQSLDDGLPGDIHNLACVSLCQLFSEPSAVLVSYRRERVRMSIKSSLPTKSRPQHDSTLRLGLAVCEHLPTYCMEVSPHTTSPHASTWPHPTLGLAVCDPLPDALCQRVCSSGHERAEVLSSCSLLFLS